MDRHANPENHSHEDARATADMTPRRFRSAIPDRDTIGNVLIVFVLLLSKYVLRLHTILSVEQNHLAKLCDGCFAFRVSRPHKLLSWLDLLDKLYSDLLVHLIVIVLEGASPPTLPYQQVGFSHRIHCASVQSLDTW